jgi:hypothetical protein
MHVMCQVMNWLGMKLGLYFRSLYHCSDNSALNSKKLTFNSLGELQHRVLL